MSASARCSPATSRIESEGSAYFPPIAAAGLSRRSLLKGAGALAAAPLLPALARHALAADTPTATQLSAQDQTDIGRIEAYLNQLKTMKARFQQVSQKGGVSHGWMYLRRPGQVRVEYDPPVPVLLVSDGTMVTYYDSELDQLNQVPLSSSPLWFLLRPEVRLNRDVTVSRLERAPGAIRITIVQTDEPGSRHREPGVPRPAAGADALVPEGPGGPGDPGGAVRYAIRHAAREQPLRHAAHAPNEGSQRQQQVAPARFAGSAGAAAPAPALARSRLHC